MMSESFRPAQAQPFGSRRIAMLALSWLAMVGVDVFLHAGLLAPLYDWGSAFLLRPDEAFTRIPIGFLGLVVMAIGLAWLLPRLEIDCGRDGARIAAALGVVGGGAVMLGLWSISTVEAELLVGWWVGQTLELAAGGYVIGAVLGGDQLRRVAWRVSLVLAVGIVSAVVFQAIGYATAAGSA